MLGLRAGVMCNSSLSFCWPLPSEGRLMPASWLTHMPSYYSSTNRSWLNTHKQSTPSHALHIINCSASCYRCCTSIYWKRLARWHDVGQQLNYHKVLRNTSVQITPPLLQPLRHQMRWETARWLVLVPGIEVGRQDSCLLGLVIGIIQEKEVVSRGFFTWINPLTNPVKQPSWLTTSFVKQKMKGWKNISFIQMSCSIEKSTD